MRVNSSKVSPTSEVRGMGMSCDCDVGGCEGDDGPGSGWSSGRRALGCGFTGACRRIMTAGFEVEDALVRATSIQKG